MKVMMMMIAASYLVRISFFCIFFLFIIYTLSSSWK